MNKNNRRQNQQKNQKPATKPVDDKVETSKQQAKTDSNPNIINNKANVLQQEPKTESKTADNKSNNQSDNSGKQSQSSSKSKAVTEPPADTATEQKKSTAAQASEQSKPPTSTKTKPAAKMDKAVSSTPHDNSSPKSDNTKSANVKSEHGEKADKQAKTATTKSPVPPAAAIPATKQPKPKKGNGLWLGLALLTGLIGTGLGAYCFNELRQSNGNKNEALTTQLSTLENKVTDLAKNDHSAALQEQLTQVVKRQDVLQAAEERFNARIAEIAQLQKGLTKSLQSNIDSALANKMTAVDELLAKVQAIELQQQGLSKNLTQVTAADRVVTEEGLTQQEVGYLLRMANYKLQFESDVSGAIGLLKMAEQKLLTLNNTANTPLIESIREKLIQLDGVTPVDSDKLLGHLQAIAREIPRLVVKTNETESQQIEVGEKAIADADNTWGKVKSVLASGIKYTPADPSKIDISAETILIKKRLMQADVKTAELAVQSHNKVMLAESIRSLTDSLNHYFADDEVAKSIKEKLTAISHSELETVLPDLAGLIKQQQTIQAQ